MGLTGQRLGLRLFLEGVEIPVIAANVQCNINAPATASIQVVPGDSVLSLRARTMVHLFFWDYTMDQDAVGEPQDPAVVADLYGITVADAKKLIEEHPESFGDRYDADLRGYRLLFCGEVMGVVFSKNAMQRQAVLQCSDFSTYWDTTYQFFISYSPGGNFLGSSAAVWAGADTLFDDLTSGHTSVMDHYLRSKPQTPGMEKVKGLMGGIISLLEAMGGVPNHTSGVNDFFTIGELKNHILQQICAEQNDDTAQRLFAEKTFMDWLTRGMTSMGQLVTFRDMMKLLFKYVYYEVVPNPCAMYIPKKNPKSTTKNVSLHGTDTMPDEAVELIGNLIGKSANYATWVFGEAKTRADEDTMGHEFIVEIDAVLKISGVPRRSKNYLEQAKNKAHELKPVALEKDEKLKRIDILATGTAEDNVRRTGFPGTIPAQSRLGWAPPRPFIDNRAIWSRINTHLTHSLRGSTYVVDKEITKTEPGELDRLYTQIFRPDCFFAAPPRCNVLFPDQCTQFQFSRNFLQECTRLRLSTDMIFGINKGAGGLLGSYHFAPATKQIKDIARTQGNKGIRALLPWEIYSGILPKFESMHEVNYVAGRAEKKMGWTKHGSLSGPVADYAQRTANFNYMKYRFSSRSCEVSAKFNPFIVCGFPMLVIDKPWILTDEVKEGIQKYLKQNIQDDMSEFVRAAARLVGAPTQFLGMVAGLGHSVSQEGGSTSITMTHARTHRITDDDFLIAYSEELVENTTDLATTVLDFDDLYKKGDYHLLRFLRDVTPQNLHEQAAETAQEQSGETGAGPDDKPVEARPGSVPATGGFGSATTPLVLPTQRSVTLPPATSVGGAGNIAITGQLVDAVMPDGREVVKIPKTPGRLAAGKGRGPRGGKIVQVACETDQAVAIVGRSVNKKLKSGKPVIVTSNIAESFSRDESGTLTINGNTIKKEDITYYWKHATIYERSKRPNRVHVKLPIEEGIRPPWFSPLYSNWKIGSDIYGPFFGTGSIVEQSLFLSPSGTTTFGTSRQKQREVLESLNAAGNDQKRIQEVIDKAAADSPVDVPDIEASVDVLAYIYGEVRKYGFDVNRFINDYTRRPIATLEEILGSADLEYSESDKDLDLKQGTPGFHSAAVANVGELKGLLTNPDIEIPRFRKGAGKKDPVNRSLDPRPGRREKVMDYLQEITAAVGSLGLGVQG